MGFEIFIIIAVLILFWIISLIQSNYELMAPVPLTLLGLLVAACLAVIGAASWNHITIGWKVVGIVVLGALSLLFGSIAGNNILASNNRCFTGACGGHQRVKSSEVYSSPLWKYALVSVVLGLAIVIRVVETYRIGAELGVDLSSFSEVVNAVREATAGYKNPDSMLLGTGFSMLERQLEKVATVAGFVSSYLAAVHLVQRKPKQVTGALMLFLLSSVFCFVTGSRASIAYYVIAFIIILFICLLRENRSPKKLAFLFFAACVVAAAVGALAFYFGVALVGRTATSGLVEYISFYFGGGLPSLQNILDVGNLPYLTPGLRTFYYLFSIPYKFGIISEYPSYSIAWVDMGGHASNIFTGFARFYLDFGYLGVVLLSFVSGILLTLLWRAAVRRGAPILLVLVGFLGSQAFDFAREEFIFSRLLSLNQLISLAIMMAMTIFLSASLRKAWNKLKKCPIEKAVEESC